MLFTIRYALMPYWVEYLPPALRLMPSTTHLEKMYNFWNGILFQANDYHGHPFRPHRAMPVQTRHFDRWVALFTATIDEHFQGDKADEVKARATQIAHIFDSKIKMLRDEQTSF
ncbi:MAG: group III truncated hemoglobin [Saprospiraceae bacterium]